MKVQKKEKFQELRKDEEGASKLRKALANKGDKFKHKDKTYVLKRIGTR